MSPDRYAGADPRAGADPSPVAHDDGLNDQIEGRRFVIVIPGAKECALGDAHIIFERDRSQVQQPALFSQPNVVADRQFPRKRDFDIGLDNDAASNAGAKEAQHPTFQRGELERAMLKQPEAHEQPEELAAPAAAPIKLGG